MTLRPATPDDLEAIVALVEAAGPAAPRRTPDGWLIAWVERLRVGWGARLLDGDARWTTVLEDDAAPILAGVVSLRPATTPGEGNLSALYVEPARQRRGVGTTLLHAAEDEMRRRGMRRAELVTAEVEAARGFALRSGWEEVGPTGEASFDRRPLVAFARSLGD